MTQRREDSRGHEAVSERTKCLRKRNSIRFCGHRGESHRQRVKVSGRLISVQYEEGFSKRAVGKYNRLAQEVFSGDG